MFRRDLDGPSGGPALGQTPQKDIAGRTYGGLRVRERNGHKAGRLPATPRGGDPPTLPHGHGGSCGEPDDDQGSHIVWPLWLLMAVSGALRCTQGTERKREKSPGVFARRGGFLVLFIFLFFLAAHRFAPRQRTVVPACGVLSGTPRAVSCQDRPTDCLGVRTLDRPPKPVIGRGALRPPRWRAAFDGQKNVAPFLYPIDLLYGFSNSNIPQTHGPRGLADAQRAELMLSSLSPPKTTRGAPFFFFWEKAGGPPHPPWARLCCALLVLGRKSTRSSPTRFCAESSGFHAQ